MSVTGKEVLKHMTSHLTAEQRTSYLKAIKKSIEILLTDKEADPYPKQQQMLEMKKIIDSLLVQE